MGVIKVRMVKRVVHLGNLNLRTPLNRMMKERMRVSGKIYNNISIKKNLNILFV